MNNTNLYKLLKLNIILQFQQFLIVECSQKNKLDLIKLIQNININNESLNVIDLFCGCGGMSKGLTEAGLNIIAGIDIWDKAIENYNKNFHHNAYCHDLTIFPPEKFNELYNKENKNIDIIVGGPPCFVSGTKVLTDTGYKNIEEILLIDNLLTHTGKFQKIVNLQKKIYNGNIYKLYIEYHPDIITCTEEHPFYVRKKKKIWDNSICQYKIIFEQPTWKIAKNLTKNDYFGMIINNNEIIPELIFDNNIEKIKIIFDKPEYLYIMGYYLGNGWIEKTKHNIRFAINKDDEQNFLEKIQKILPITDYKTNIRKCKIFSYSNFLWFQIFQMFGKYVYDKIIPEWVQNAPLLYIQEFINGYIKANGLITDNSIIQIITISYNVAYGIQRLFLKLGHIIGINKLVNQQQIYCIRGILYRKKNKLSFIENNYVWYAPSNIIQSKITEEIVYNFEVSNDNSYIVENIIVHNCQSYSIAGKRDKNDPRNTLFMEYVKYLNYFKPKLFMMENVIGILSKKTDNGKNVIDIIMEELNINYNCIINKLYASDFEVPQNRRRTIIIGIRKDLNITPIEPTKIISSINNRIPVKNILLSRDQINNSYFLSDKAIQGIINKKKKSKEKGTGFGAQFLDLDKPSYTIPARYWKDGYDALVKYNETEIRRLTILELKRIQSFPDDYIIEGTKKDIIMQIGNAVACRFAYHLGRYIINILQ